MGAGKIIHLRPDRTDFSGFTTVETYALVQNGAAHRFFFHIVVITVDEGGFRFQFFFGKLCLVFFADSLEIGFAGMFVGIAGLCKLVSFGVCLVVHVLAQIFVVFLVAIYALGLADSFGEFQLHSAVVLDGFVRHTHCLQQVCFGNFVHFTFNHHDVVDGGSYHYVQIGLFKLGESRINDIFPVYAGYPHFGNRSVERHVADRYRGGSGQASQSVGHVHAVGRIKGYVYKSFSVIIIREQRTQSPVHQACRQNLGIGSPALPAGETAGETTCGSEFLLVLHSQRHEVGARHRVLRGANRCQKHGLAHTHHYRAVGLFGQLAGLDGNGPAITQCDGFCYYIHTFNVKTVFYSKNQAKLA